MMIERGKIYMVTVMLYKNDSTVDYRTWAWYTDVNKALNSVETNMGDMFESTYNYALVEEIEEGMPARSKVIQWYKAVYKKGINFPRVVKIKEPKQFKRQCNFSIG